jgi:hypothetical protein
LSEKLAKRRRIYYDRVSIFCITGLIRIVLPIQSDHWRLARMLRRCLMAVVFAGISHAGFVFADDPLLEELYGRGVHAYYSRDDAGAIEALSQAIAQGSTDPRVHYFRGLAQSRLGRPDEAKADFQAGAQLEAKHSDKATLIGRSLERVQGSVRIELENTRRSVRFASRSNEQAVVQQTIANFENAEKEVVRNKKTTVRAAVQPAAAEEAVAGPAATKPAVAAAEVDPFGGSETPAAETAPAPMPKPAVTDSADPFGEPAPATEKPATETPAPMPKPTEGADPFGESPASESPAPQPMPKPAAEADPFGDTPATPTAEKPAPMPAAEADPFGEAPAKPATEAVKPADPAADATTPAAAGNGKVGGSVLRAFSSPFRSFGKVLEGGVSAAPLPGFGPPGGGLDGPPPGFPAEGAPGADPFGEPPVGAPATEEKMPKEEAQPDPFAEEPASAPTAEKMPKEEATADPFGDDAPATKATPAEETAPAAEEKPAAEKPAEPAAEADPFADDPAPAAEKPAAEKPAEPAAEVDPFQ